MRTAMDHAGFTLIEVIVTIIVSSILAVLLAQFMSGHITRSYWSLEKLDSGLALREVMETVDANYRRLLTENSSPIVALQADVDSGVYWAGQPYGSAIRVKDSYCFELDHNGESNPIDNCQPSDTLYKVTISLEEHSLTALFSR